MTWPRHSRVADVSLVDSGPAFKSAQFVEGGVGVRLLRGDNIEPGALRWTRTKEWPHGLAGDLKHLLVAPGDLILGMDRPVISTGLKLARVQKNDCPALLVQRVARIRPHAIDGRYLYHWLSEGSFAAQLQHSAAGTQLPHVTLKAIRDFTIPRFGEAEESQIVEILEDHLSRLDAAEHYRCTAERRLGRLQDQLVSDTITGSDYGGPRAASDLTPDSTVDGSLPRLPADWRWRRLGDIADVVGGVTKDSKKQEDPAFVEVPYLRVANVQRGLLRLDDVTTIRVSPTKAERLRLRPGDVLLNEGGDRDKLARGWVWEGQIERCIHQNHVFRARPHAGIDPYFVSWCANTIGGRWAERNGKQSVNLASISLSMIRKMPVIVPPIATAQEQIAKLHDRLGDLDRTSASLAEAGTRSLGLRRAVLAAAFSGRLTGRRTDDEIIEELAEAGV